MEDAAKVTSKKLALQAETGKTWFVVSNTNHLVDSKAKVVADIKTYVCVNGEVRDFPVSDFVK